MNKPTIKSTIKPLKPTIKSTIKPLVPKYQGRGTRARLNTAAEKMMFNSKHS